MLKKYQVWRVDKVTPLTLADALTQAKAAVSNCGGNKRAFVVEIVGTVQPCSPPVEFTTFIPEED